jgi:hypothetical protein
MWRCIRQGSKGSVGLGCCWLTGLCCCCALLLLLLLLLLLDC